MYVIGIDYGHGETSAAVLEIANELYEKIALLEKEDYSMPQAENEPSSLEDKLLAIEMAGAMLNTFEPASAPMLSSMDDNSDKKDVIDTNREWDIKTIRGLLAKSFGNITDLKIKGDSKTIKSVLVYDWKKEKWEIGPNIQKLKQCVSNLDYEKNQYARMAAYFKGPLVGGKGKEHDSNDLKTISSENRVSFGIFVEHVFRSIIENNTIIHETPRNYRLYVACPSEWDKDQIDEYISFLNERGISCEEVVQESRAAYMSFRDTILGNTINDEELPGVLVIDFGSSTIDFTYFGGEKTINHGYQKGAHRVEEIIFDYLCENEPTAKDAFRKLTEALNGDELLAKALLVFSIRNMKEKFFTDLAENEDTLFEDIPLKNVVIPEKDSGVRFIADAFGFDIDNGGGCDRDKMRKILNGYIEDVKYAFLDFKTKDGVGNINHVILTGGASKMQFIRELTEEVFDVHKYSLEERNNGKKDTLHVDDEPSYSISRGIAKYGTYRTLSEPIRKAIEKRLYLTWRNEKWINRELNKLIPELVQQVYNDKLNSIVDEWTKEDSPIVMNVNHNLYDVLDVSIIERGKNNDSMQIWNNIDLSRDFDFRDGKHSLHALLRVIYDDIELNNDESKKIIDDRLQKALIERINELVGSLFKKYINIYFDESELSVYAELPENYNIEVIIEDSQKENLLMNLIETVFTEINNCAGCTQDKWSFNCDRSPHSGFNATRDQLYPVIKGVIADFCKTIKPNFEIEKISIVCKESVEKKFAEIKDLCEKEPYSLKV